MEVLPRFTVTVDLDGDIIHKVSSILYLDRDESISYQAYNENDTATPKTTSCEMEDTNSNGRYDSTNSVVLVLTTDHSNNHNHQ
jgi:hypothetical protein